MQQHHTGREGVILHRHYLQVTSSNTWPAHGHHLDAPPDWDLLEASSSTAIIGKIWKPPNLALKHDTYPLLTFTYHLLPQAKQSTHSRPRQSKRISNQLTTLRAWKVWWTMNACMKMCYSWGCDASSILLFSRNGFTSSQHLCRFPSQRTFDPEDFHAACSSTPIVEEIRNVLQQSNLRSPEPSVLSTTHGHGVMSPQDPKHLRRQWTSGMSGFKLVFTSMVKVVRMSWIIWVNFGTFVDSIHFHFWTKHLQDSQRILECCMGHTVSWFRVWIYAFLASSSCNSCNFQLQNRSSKSTPGKSSQDLSIQTNLANSMLSGTCNSNSCNSNRTP